MKKKLEPHRELPEVADALREARHTFADALRAHMRFRLKDYANQPIELQRRSGVGKSNINRYLNPDGDDYAYPTLESIVKIASALKIHPFELFLNPATARDLYTRGAAGRDRHAEDAESHRTELKRRRHRPTAS